MMNPWDNYHTVGSALFRIGRLPVYVTTLVVALQVLALVLTAIIGFNSPAIYYFAYTADAMEAGRLWTLITYVLIDQLDFWTALSLVFFYLFGLRVELHLGPQRYLSLLGVLVLGPTLLLTVSGLLVGDPFDLRTSFLGRFPGYWSSMNVRLCVLVAFCWLYSNALFWPGIQAKWFGVFFVALQTLQFLGMRAWLFFWMCWISLLLAYITLRRMGLEMKFAAIEEPLLNMLPSKKPKGYRQSKRKLRLVKEPKGPSKRHRYESKLSPKMGMAESEGTAASVDHLLEKIAREGISSLSDAERKQLESASDRLSDEDSKGS